MGGPGSGRHGPSQTAETLNSLTLDVNTLMRDNWLSNRVFKSAEEIVALACWAWNKFVDQPWKIISIGAREWANA